MKPPKIPRPDPIPRVPSPFISRLAEVDVPDFWATVADRLPLVEETGRPGEVVVTFCWRDAEAEQVLLFANRLTDETALADTMLTRLGDTDLWHASFLMASDWRASYSFLVQHPGEQEPWRAEGHVALRAALDVGRPDPLNPARCLNSRGTQMSVVSLPDAPPQPWLAERRAATVVPAGEVTEYAGPDDRPIWVYRHPMAAADAPLLVVLDGEVWLHGQRLALTLDNLATDAATPPMTALFVSSGGRDQRWAELGGDAGTAFVTGELLEWAAERHLGVQGPVLVAGQSLGGLTALRAGLTRPDRVHGVLSCSASLWVDDLHGLVGQQGASELRIHLCHGSQEWVLTEPHHELAGWLDGAGVQFEARAYNGGHDYAWWRGAIADGLVWFFAS